MGTPTGKNKNDDRPIQFQNLLQSISNWTNINQEKPNSRVCIVTSEFPGIIKNGGIATANAELAKLLALEGYNASFSTIVSISKNLF